MSRAIRASSAAFSQSPNGQVKLGVMDAGISMTGPYAKILLGSGRVDVNCQETDAGSSGRLRGHPR